MFSSVVSLKRQIPKAGPIENSELDLDDAQRMARLPGRYIEAGTCIKISAKLERPIFPHSFSYEDGIVSNEIERRPLFTRAVYLFPYREVRFLQLILRQIAAINQEALPGVSIRSYQLTEEQINACEDGSLDVITGFHIVDSNFRIIVVEGLAASAMSKIERAVLREDANSSSIKIIRDSSIRFTRRLYTRFNVDLKVVHIREPLEHMVKGPDIYDRNIVDEQCYKALMSLVYIRSAACLRELASSQAFPRANMLINLESVYGEAVSLEDIEGKKPQRRMSTMMKFMSASSDDAPKARRGVRSVPSHESMHATSTRRKAATDCRNPEYLKARAARTTQDFLGERKKRWLEVTTKTKKERAAREKAEEEEFLKSGRKEIFIYSGQKLQSTEFQKEEMRKRLAKKKGSSFTYSSDFQSLSFSLINQDDVKRNADALSKSQYTTSRGFVYPAPRDSAESRRHKRAVSSARAEELREPWIENLYHPKPLERGDDGASAGKTFDSVPVKDVIFGGYHADGSRNPDFFKSVHLNTDDMAAEIAAEKKREEEEWRARILGPLHFRPHCGLKGKACNADKMKDILDGEAVKKGIRVVRKAKLPSGKRIPFEQTPATIFLEDPWVDLSLKTAKQGLRGSGDDTKLKGPKHMDFTGGRAKSKIYTRMIMPMGSSEKVGPKWYA